MPAAIEIFIPCIMGFIVLCLPGISISLWLSTKRHDLFEHLADVIGLSISFSALLGLIAFLADWHFSATGLLILEVILGVFTIAGLVHYRKSSRQPLFTTSKQDNATTPSSMVSFLILASVFIAILAWRFYQIHSLVLPAWVDSLHHVLITKHIQQNGGIPRTLAPDLPIPFYYHFAFHLVTALFATLAKLPPHQATLWLGQVLNAAIALSTYRLAQSLWGDWRRSGFAAASVGFISQMPAYYVSWGRYTLLTGLVLLPLAMATALDITKNKSKIASTLRLALLTCGTLLSHYFAALLLVIFLGILMVKSLHHERKQKTSLVHSRWLSLGMGAFLGAVASSPWLVRVWHYAGSEINLTPVLTSQSIHSVYFPEYTSYLWRMLGPQRNYLLVALATLGIAMGWATAKRREFILWSLLLGILSLPLGLRIRPFRPDHTIIVLFLPVTLLASDFLFTCGDLLRRGRYNRVADGLLGATLFVLLAWGLIETRSIINPTTILATSEDMRAMEWIVKNTPSETRFFINVTPWQYGTYRGVDGGWWIPILTGRWALLPPVLYATGGRDYIYKVNALAEQASQIHGCSPQFWQLIQQVSITHIYIVEGRGSLQPDSLQNCIFVESVYSRGKTFIYQVKDQNTDAKD